MRPVRVACDTQTRDMLVCELNAGEMRALRPESDGVRLSVMFLRDYVQLLDLDVARELTRKYYSLHIVDAYGNRLDAVDELDRLEGSETRQLATLYRLASEFDIDAVGMSQYEIKLAIRNARSETAMFANLPIAEAGMFNHGSREA
ncbi:MAG: hypothetical protein K8R90_10370 [Candidatus Cloacimonetes bacterium]|nr:hypothetical protein [Candidatus Cloacimonadota bacterium]